MFEPTIFPSWMGENPRKCAPWTPAEDELLKKEYAYGIGTSRMCAVHGRDAGGIESRLQKLIPGYMEGWRPSPLPCGRVINANNEKLASLESQIQRLSFEISKLKRR